MSWVRNEWDRVLGFSLIALGAVFVVVGYRGVSSSPYVADQLSYIVSGGLGGLFCLGAGATLLITADLHDEWRKLDRLEAALRDQPVPAAGAPTGENRSAVEPAGPIHPPPSGPEAEDGWAASSPESRSTHERRVV